MVLGDVSNVAAHHSQDSTQKYDAPMVLGDVSNLASLETKENLTKQHHIDSEGTKENDKKAGDAEEKMEEQSAIIDAEAVPNVGKCCDASEMGHEKEAEAADASTPSQNAKHVLTDTELALVGYALFHTHTRSSVDRFIPLGNRFEEKWCENAKEEGVDLAVAGYVHYHKLNNPCSLMGVSIQEFDRSAAGILEWCEYAKQEGLNPGIAGEPEGEWFGTDEIKTERAVKKLADMELAIVGFALFHNLPVTASSPRMIQMIQQTSAGIQGWCEFAKHKGVDFGIAGFAHYHHRPRLATIIADLLKSPEGFEGWCEYAQQHGMTPRVTSKKVKAEQAPTTWIPNNSLCERLFPEDAGFNTLTTLPQICVTKWVDYSSKYGLGYMLLDGSVGVHFNDSTKIISSPCGTSFNYITRNTQEQPENQTTHSFENHPPELRKKVKLLRHFEQCLVTGQAGTPVIRGSDSPVVSTCGPLCGPSAKSLLPREVQQPPEQVYVTKWIQDRHSTLFVVGKKTMTGFAQVVFIDGTTLLVSLHQNGTVTYIDKQHQLFSSTLSSASNDTIPGIERRLQYTKGLLEKLSGKYRTPSVNAGGA